MRFSDFELPAQIHRSLAAMKFETPTDVQRRSIPIILEGRDLLATAQTGTGKTAAFGIPLLAKLIKGAEGRVLIVAPTRELAEQIAVTIKDLTSQAQSFKHAVIIGGAPFGPQIRQLRAKPAFVIGTPGRIIDHVGRGAINLAQFKYLVLDEADRMLDMGFEPQIDQIVRAMPQERQTLMFSATIPPEVRQLVMRYLKNPQRVAVGEENRPVARIQQDVIEMSEGTKRDAIITEIDKLAGSIIVFTRTKVRADIVARMLQEVGHKAAPLHGDLTQGQRRRVTQKFREEEIRILVATDIAARGLDIPHVRHVLNFDLPLVPEDYVHRIGRTGRMGAEGHSIAFVTPQERNHWNRIRRVMGDKTAGQKKDHGGKFGPRQHEALGRKFEPSTPAGEERSIEGNPLRGPKKTHEQRPERRSERKPEYKPHTGKAFEPRSKRKEHDEYEGYEPKRKGGQGQKPGQKGKKQGPTLGKKTDHRAGPKSSARAARRAGVQPGKSSGGKSYGGGGKRADGGKRSKGSRR